MFEIKVSVVYAKIQKKCRMICLWPFLGQTMMMKRKIRKYVAMLKLSRSAFFSLLLWIKFSFSMLAEISEEHMRMQISAKCCQMKKNSNFLEKSSLRWSSTTRLKRQLKFSCPKTRSHKSGNIERAKKTEVIVVQKTRKNLCKTWKLIVCCFLLCKEFTWMKTKREWETKWQNSWKEETESLCVRFSMGNKQTHVVHALKVVIEDCKLIIKRFSRKIWR